MNRGAARQDIFSDDADRHLFLDLLGDLDDRYGVETHAYCLMGNHYHLMLRSRCGRISSAIQDLAGKYTRQTNRRSGRDGPLFRGRFHSVAITTDAQLLAVVRYVHRNPLDLGWPRRLEDYIWSSHAAYLGTRPGPPWLHRDRVLAYFAGDADSYAAFVRCDPTELSATSPPLAA